MWSDLFKRWLDMVTWWMPRGTNDRDDAEAGPSHASSRSGGSPSSEAGQQTSASRSASGTTATSHAGSDSSSGQKAQSSPEAKASDPATEPASPSDPADDLTAIKGIGPAIKERLHDNGIRSFRDLANADVTELTSQLKEQTAISEKRVQGWIDEARKHAK